MVCLGVDIQDFGGSWKDGRALAALVHSLHPQLFDYKALVAQRDPKLVLEKTFAHAEELGIAQLLKINDVLGTYLGSAALWCLAIGILLPKCRSCLFVESDLRAHRTIVVCGVLFLNSCSVVLADLITGSKVNSLNVRTYLNRIKLVKEKGVVVVAVCVAVDVAF